MVQFLKITGKMLLLCKLPLYCCDVKYAHTVQEMKFSSKLQAFELLVEYVRLLISFEQKKLYLFLLFCSAKIPVKVNDEYNRTMWKSYTNTRHVLDLRIRKCFL